MSTVVMTAVTIHVVRALDLHPSNPQPKKRTAATAAKNFVTYIMTWVDGADLAYTHSATTPKAHEAVNGAKRKRKHLSMSHIPWVSESLWWSYDYLGG